jgi:hypothetical protein
VNLNVLELDEFSRIELVDQTLRQYRDAEVTPHDGIDARSRTTADKDAEALE